MALYQFQTEVNQLLTLIIHSLYSNKDIFLREIISNASDALDKLKYLTFSDDNYRKVIFDPRIDILFDEQQMTITVKDSGIGMDQSDLISNLGTIAKSGTKAFIEKLDKDEQKNSGLIGQFGVGFYSAFMVASKIEVITRHALKSETNRWVSDGKGSYELDLIKADDEINKMYGFDKVDAHGTAVVIYLSSENKDFATRWKIEDIVKRYSDHIAFPIFLTYMEKKYDDKGNIKTSEEKTEIINSASALWQKSKNDLTENDYNSFYKAISHDSTNPLLYIHTKAEGLLEYTTLFYIPEHAPYDLYQADYKSGIKLYVKRVFITDDDRELLPSWLRFVLGVIDSEDLPLNVSREILQQNKILSTIKAASVKKILSEFKNISENDKEKWTRFISQYNKSLKEGLYSDYANRDELCDLVRFKTTSSEAREWTSFMDYVGRMKPDQKAIYYITGNDEKMLRHSPLLEAYNIKNIEVLILDDEIDEIVIPVIGKFKDYELKSVNRSGSDEELDNNKTENDIADKNFKQVIEKIKKTLGEKVKDVRISKRLLDSPACVIFDENDPSIQFEKMMKAMGQAERVSIKPILEINTQHPLIESLKSNDDNTYIEDVSVVLLDQALLVGGADLEDSIDFVKRLNRLLEAKK